MICSLRHFEADNTGRDELTSDDAAGGCWLGHDNAHCNRFTAPTGQAKDLAMVPTATKAECVR